jgi:hypothetical protein
MKNELETELGCTMNQAVADFPHLRPVFNIKSSHVEFVVGTVSLERIFPEDFGFP